MKAQWLLTYDYEYQWLDCRTTDLSVLNTLAPMSLLQCPHWLTAHPRPAWGSCSSLCRHCWLHWHSGLTKQNMYGHQTPVSDWSIFALPIYNNVPLLHDTILIEQRVFQISWLRHNIECILNSIVRLITPEKWNFDASSNEILPKINLKGYIKCLFLDLTKITGNAFLLLVE
jgi:hypothetical protein